MINGWLQTIMRFPRGSVAALVILGGVAAVAVAASGVIPIKASSGHWAVTEWFLEFSMRRSVSMHARFAVATPPEDLDDFSRVLRGAGHYETGCRPCHGAPGDPLPAIAEVMTPQPPKLSPVVPHWEARELFYIVKHGIKMTGMPAWPALERDDEVWSMVAFLRRLPALDAAGYEALVHGEGTSPMELFAGTTPIASPPDVIVEVCARCHGIDGRGRGVGAFPKLAGQRLEYMVRSMDAYAEGRRNSGIMELVASGLEEEAALAALRYYASLPPPALLASHPGEDATPLGAAIARRGIPDDDVPSCVDCHGPTAHPVNEAYPRLAGQYAGYLADQLRLMKERRRGGSEFVHIMHNFVDRLEPEHIEAVAAYFGEGAPEAHAQVAPKPGH